MLTIDQYLRPATLEEAYEAAQKKNSVVLGGMLWLRLGNRRIGTAVDLSALGLDTVEETDDAYRIGAYVSLRTLETHPAIGAVTDGVLRNAVRDIVGVQFRNLATVGGSVFGRFGFSDVVTSLLALGASVELYKTGTVSLEEFCRMGKVNDLLTHIRLPKKPVLASYQVQRSSATDFPVLNTCAVLCGDELRITVGARPSRAVLYTFDADGADGAAGAVADQTVFASNTRASEEYRRHLCRVLVSRAAGDVLSRRTAAKEDGLWK
ncbi:MAG: FAD binding domain-containing protein [Clostridia bacterium]|nr:FAD binding domain-containing protein [Clostridia bacterium]